MLSLSALVGCSDQGVAGPDGHFGTAESWIINGDLDTVNQATVALFTQQSGCTGTIIHVSGSNAYVLTAAHCFGPGPIQQVAIGNDYNNATAVLGVADYDIHPQWDANNLTYDFAILRATGANSGTPVVPALTPSEDQLTTGTQVEHSGYGLISWPNGSTTKRHHAFGNLSQVAQIQIGYDQPVQGPCSGDSGGPNYIQTSNGKRVAGVISYGDQECNQLGVSGRVSAVYSNFIAPFIGTDPSTSSATTTAATGSTTVTTAGVGGGGATTDSGATSGQGGGYGDAGRWGAGVDEQDYTGEVLSSGCAVGGGERGAASWLLAAAAGLMVSRRRRAAA